MNKLFIVLLTFTIIGAGILWWLIQASPGGNSHHKVETPALGLSHDSHEKEEKAEAPAEKAHTLSEVATEKKAEAPTAAAPAVAAPPATLKIITDPEGANVFVNGIEAGKTPLDVPLVKGEAQKIKMEKDGFEEIEKEVPGDHEEGDMTWKIPLKKVKAKEIISHEKHSHKKIKEHKAMMPPPPTEEEIQEAKEEEDNQEAPKHPVEASLPNVKAPVSVRHKPEPKPLAHKAKKDEHAKMSGYVVQMRSLNLAESSMEQIETELKNAKERFKVENIFICKVKLASKGEWARIQMGPFRNLEFAKTQLEYLQTQEPGVEAFVAKAQPCRK